MCRKDRETADRAIANTAVRTRCNRCNLHHYMHLFCKIYAIFSILVHRKLPHESPWKQWTTYLVTVRFSWVQMERSLCSMLLLLFHWQSNVFWTWWARCRCAHPRHAHSSPDHTTIHRQMWVSAKQPNLYSSMYCIVYHCMHLLHY